jgi:hypothetical protein
MEICFGEEGKEWLKGISDGGAGGAQHPPGRARWGWRGLVGVAHQVHLPQVIFAPVILKNSEKIKSNFQGNLRTLIFQPLFYCTGKTENRQNMAIYFI